MIVKPTPLKDCFLIEPKVFEDNRGYFFESFNRKKFHELTGIRFDIVQENQSRSTKGVLRGMHFQIKEHSQAKLVRTLQGEVLDVVIDLRKDSPTFGQHHKEILSAVNRKQLFIPGGFAHGFLILTEAAEFFYGVDRGYAPDFEFGLMYNDPYFKVDWSYPDAQIILSDRDKKWPSFKPNHDYFD